MVNFNLVQKFKVALNAPKCAKNNILPCLLQFCNKSYYVAQLTATCSSMIEQFFWFHDSGINRCRVVVMTHQNILLESTGQWLVLNVINLSQFGRKVRFPLRKETYSTLSILFYQFYANLELSERITGISNFSTKNCRFAFSFISIALLYYYFINSVYLSSNEKFKGRALNKVSFRIVSTAVFTQVSL